MTITTHDFAIDEALAVSDSLIDYEDIFEVEVLDTDFTRRIASPMLWEEYDRRFDPMDDSIAF